METKSLTIADALPLAEKHIAEVISSSARLRGYAFLPVHFWRETDRYWVFSSVSPQSQAEGRVPGAISACVDKHDGHIWSTKEQEQYAQSLSPIPPPARPVNAVGQPMLEIEVASAIAQRAIAEIICRSRELQNLDFNSGRFSGFTNQYWKFTAVARDATHEVSVFLDPFDGRLLSAEEVAHCDAGQSSIPQTEAVAA